MSVVAASAFAQAAPPAAGTTARLIVKFRGDGQKALTATSARVARFAADAGVALKHLRAMAQGAHVLVLDRPLAVAAADALVARLAQHPDVEYVQRDSRRRAQRIPNDEWIGFQTYLDNTAGGISAFAAWDVTTGSPNVVVAIVDSGYRPHADLAGRILPGYDFIADAKTANDGGGRDADASDPGDWIDATDLTDPEFGDCSIERSSWHGTSVAGVVGANSDNGQSVAGINWAAKLLPVRVLGKCGGYDSDIIDGVAWAAGLAVPGVPANSNPAQIINMSLGGEGDCLAAYHSVFSATLAHGVTRAIIVAAGNGAEDVVNNAPANCSEVIAVASTATIGWLATYSNFGSGITLSAPGGDFSAGVDGIFVLSNNGATVPTSDSTGNEGGTSLAAPMVSGVVSLILAVAPNRTAGEIRALLTSTAKPFPPGSDCTTDRCGAGILNAYAAVVAAQSAAPLNFQGLWWNAPAASEDGWGINFAHQGDTIFASWFTYDLTGKGWWLVMTAVKTANDTYTGTLYQTHGPAFNAMPFAPKFVATAVGTGTLTFSDANNGTFAYTVNAISQTKTITRQVFGPLPTCTYGAQPNLALATNYQDLWWNAPAASEDGWGINFTHQGDTIFATWFTYDLDGTPLWLVVTAPKTGPGTYAGTLYRTTGPAFNAVPFAPKFVPTAVGTATLTFADGNNAMFTYTVQLAGMPSPVTQSKAVTRELFVPPAGTVCQ